MSIAFQMYYIAKSVKFDDCENCRKSTYLIGCFRLCLLAHMLRDKAPQLAVADVRLTVGQQEGAHGVHIQIDAALHTKSRLNILPADGDRRFLLASYRGY